MPCMSTNATAHTASPPPIAPGIGARVDIFPRWGDDERSSERSEGSGYPRLER